jgi:hypothetical protein
LALKRSRKLIGGDMGVANFGNSGIATSPENIAYPPGSKTQD